MLQYTDRAWISRAWVAGSLVHGSGWVLHAWLSGGKGDWDTSIIRCNERSFVFLSGAMRRFPPSSLYEYWRHMSHYVALFFYLHFARSSNYGLVVFTSTGAIWRLESICFFPCFRHLLVSPLPFYLHLCWPLSGSSL